MKIEDIVRQLYLAIPYSDTSNYFSELISATSITSSGLVATVTTSSPHGLTTNDYVHVSGAVTPNSLTSLSAVGSIASATTTNDHDLTFGYQSTVEIIGVDQSEYNGTKTLLSVPNRRNFTYQLDIDGTNPTTGVPTLLETLVFGYNGWHKITVIDDFNFTYALVKINGSPAQGSFIVKYKARVAGAITLERAVQSYTKQAMNNIRLFVIMNDEIANKSRTARTDATYEGSKNIYYAQITIQTFSIYAFIPAKYTVGARIVRDLAEDLKPIICNSVLGVKFDSNFTSISDSTVVFSKSGFVAYDGAVYIHEFLFEATSIITLNDIYIPTDSVAFRDIDVVMNLIVGNYESDDITTNIDLDDNPL